jgi:hypothetical protein
MNYTTTYTLTLEIMKKLIWQQLVAQMPRFAVFYVVIITGLLFAHHAAGSAVNDPVILSLVGFLIGLVITVWIFRYRRAVAKARTALEVTPDPAIRIAFTDTALEWSNATSSQTVEWAKINRLREVKDFILLKRDRLHLFQIPKACLTPEALAFVKAKVQENR